MKSPFQVICIIKLIDPNLPTAIKYVRQYKAKKVIYDIEMINISDSQAIPDAYGLFWQKKSGKRPPDGLRGLTLTNVTTFYTRVRVQLLKEVAQKHQAANPSISCFVTNYLPRPELKIRDRKGPLLSLTYTKTITQFSHYLKLDFLKDLYQYAHTNMPEAGVAERFLVLSSDLLCSSPQNLISMSVDEGSEQTLGNTLPPSLPLLPPSTSTSTPSLSMAPSSTPQPIVQLGSPEFGIFPQMVPVSQPSTSPPPPSLPPPGPPRKFRREILAKEIVVDFLGSPPFTLSPSNFYQINVQKNGVSLS